MKVHSIETFGTHEGPGIRLVVFLQGCNLNCAYCHNPDTISLQGGKEMSSADIIKLLANQQSYFSGGGGITISGGEPSLQATEVIKLFTEAKKLGYHTALDTNGTIFTSETKKLLALADLSLIDFKHYNLDWHLKLTGRGNESVFKTIENQENNKKVFWIRYVLVPGWTDQVEHLEAMAKYLSKFKYLERLEILPYHTLGVYKYKELGLVYNLNGVTPPTVKEIKMAGDIFKKYLGEELAKY